MVVAAESDCIAADDLAIRGHEAHVAAAVKIRDDYEKAGPCGLCSRHAWANGVSKPLSYSALRSGDFLVTFWLFLCFNRVGLVGFENSDVRFFGAE